MSVKNEIICKSDHVYNEALARLPVNQGGRGRHLCAGCAFEQGFSNAKRGIDSPLEYEDLYFSERGHARHKSVIEAYKLGRKHGMKARRKKI